MNHPAFFLPSLQALLPGALVRERGPVRGGRPRPDRGGRLSQRPLHAIGEGRRLRLRPGPPRRQRQRDSLGLLHHAGADRPGGRQSGAVS